MLSSTCICNIQRTCTHCTASTTQSSVSTLPVATPQAKLFSGCRVFTLAPHLQIAGNSAQTFNMAFARVLSSSTCGDVPYGPPSALGPLSATSSSIAGTPAIVQLSYRDLTCQGYVGQGARPAGQYHECDFDWLDHARAIQNLVDAQQAEAMALRSGSLRTSKTEKFTEQPSAHLQQHHDERQDHQQQEQPTMASATVCTNYDENGNHQGNAITTTAASSRLQSCVLASELLDSGLGLAPHSPSVAGLDTHETASGKTMTEALMHPPTSRLEAAPTTGSTATAPSAASAEASQCSASFPSTLNGAKPSNVSIRTTGNRHINGSSVMTDQDSTFNVASSDAPQGASWAAYEGARWEEFYRAHPSARFFKERRYLLLEFPDLLHYEHVAEIGCGCGSSILPVLKANQAARTTCTDISTTSLHQLREAAAAEGIALSRVTLFPADATDPGAAQAFEGIDADAILIMFTLSAVKPEQQHVMLSHAWRVLRPGGRLLLRDHGLYDMVQLRIPADQWIGPNLYKRGDGTIAYFFSTEELSRRAIGTGFDVIECKYVTIINRNRKTGIELRRVFVHGVFEKPAARLG